MKVGKGISVLLAFVFILCACQKNAPAEITNAPAASAVTDTATVLDTTVTPDTTATPDTTTPKAPDTDSSVTDGVTETSRPAVETVAPGTWPDPESIPKADRTNVGKTEKYTPEAYDRLYYYYNKETGFERLVVMKNVRVGESYVLLNIYDTDLGGIAGLCAFLSNGATELELVDCANISAYEAMHFNTWVDNGDHPLEERVDFASPGENPNSRQHYIIGIFENGEIRIQGNMGSSLSTLMQGKINTLERILERFSLSDKIIG